MRHRIVAEIVRPDTATLARAAQIHVGVAGHFAGPRQVADAAIKPLDPGMRVCGPAVTVRPEYFDDMLVGELAPKYLQTGDVLVVDGAGRTDGACWGAALTADAQRAGAAGIVIDGALMNSAIVAEKYTLPIFARGTTARGGGAEKPGSINVPVVCGGVIVAPGDIVIGDSDGIVVLPRARAAAILDAAAAFGTRDAPRQTDGRPYFERRNSEQRLRDFKEIEWP